MKTTLLIATKICTSSPDGILCSWLPQGPILAVPELDTMKIIGLASEFGKCNFEMKMHWFQFIPIFEKQTMLWILSKIQAGECPGFYKP